MAGKTAAAVLLAAAGAAGCGAAHGAPRMGKIAAGRSADVVFVGESEWKIGVAARRAPDGPVGFRVVNKGDARHELVVIRTSRAAAKLPMKGAVASEAGAVGEVEGLRHGQTKTLRAKLAPGHYALICNLPGHYRRGMFADFAVR